MNVRFGSEADMRPSNSDVGFTPKADIASDWANGPKARATTDTLFLDFATAQAQSFPMRALSHRILADGIFAIAMVGLAGCATAPM
ncbi:MAG: hypothetical protein WA669_01050, partial [Pseudolabrys sp.]